MNCHYIRLVSLSVQTISSYKVQNHILYISFENIRREVEHENEDYMTINGRLTI